MPALPVIADVWRVTFNWSNTVDSRSAHNVMHFEDTTSDPHDVFNNINAHVTAAMWDGVATVAKVDSLTILPLDGFSASTTIATDGTAKWKGAGFGDIIPQCCCLVTLYTGERGRSRRGRVYLPWMPEGETGDGIFTDQAAANTAWNNFLTAMNLTTTIPQVASYKLESSRAVSAYLVRTSVKTQRRRARP